MPRTSKKDRSGHMQEETTAKHKLNLDNDEPGTDNSPTSSPLRGKQQVYLPCEVPKIKSDQCVSNHGNWKVQIDWLWWICLFYTSFQRKHRQFQNKEKREKMKIVTSFRKQKNITDVSARLDDIKLK